MASSTYAAPLMSSSARASCAATCVASISVRHDSRVYSSSKMRAGAPGGGAVPVSALTAAMAAPRKWPRARRAGIGVAGPGCCAEVRKGAGMVCVGSGW